MHILLRAEEDPEPADRQAQQDQIPTPQVLSTASCRLRGIDAIIQGFLNEHLSDNLKLLYCKNVQRNQYANFVLGDQINIFIDVLPEEREHEYLLQF